MRVKIDAQDFDNALNVFFALHAAAGDFVGNLVVLLGLEVAEREVLELPLQLPDAQPVGERRVDLHRLLRHAAALGRRPELERLHVVEPVGQLDEDHADVLGHGQEHLAHVLGPQVLPVQLDQRPPVIAFDVQELHLVELGDAVDQTRNFAAEATLQLGHGHVAVFGDVVAQGGDDRRGVHAQAGQRFGHRQRVIDVRLARLAQLGAVRLGRERVGTPNRFDVWRRQIFGDVVEECLWAVRKGRSSGRHGTVVPESTTARAAPVFPFSSEGAMRAAP